MRLRYQVDRLERAEALDGLVKVLETWWGIVLPRGRARDVLHGTWLGHPLHPLLTDVAIGCWSSAGALDLAGGERGRKAAQTLTGLGVLSAVPTVLSGAVDWLAIGEAAKPKRVGAVHAVANVGATALYAASWLARRNGAHGRGKALAAAATAAATAGGYLGGHLVFRNAIGASRNADENGVTDWTDVGLLRDLPMREPVRRTVGGTDLVLYRNGSTVRALSATCSHLGGPLDEGRVEDECVTCPWHGSTFRLTDGAVTRGPATAPQPAYEVRVVGRTVQVRLELVPARERAVARDEEGAPLPA
jgi:nitrite reductase/ring-hydroxylating ferredoxin subunit